MYFILIKKNIFFLFLIGVTYMPPSLSPQRI